MRLANIGIPLIIDWFQYCMRLVNIDMPLVAFRVCVCGGGGGGSLCLMLTVLSVQYCEPVFPLVIW